MKKIIVSIFILSLCWGCSRKGLIEQTIGEKVDACKPNVPCIIKIKNLTDFQWDEMHVFSSGSSLGEIEDTLKTDFPEYVALKRRMIFLKDGKIVHWENEPTDMENMIEGEVRFDGMEREPSQLSFTPESAVFEALRYFPSSAGVAYHLKQIK